MIPENIRKMLMKKRQELLTSRIVMDKGNVNDAKRQTYLSRCIYVIGDEYRSMLRKYGMTDVELIFLKGKNFKANREHKQRQKQAKRGFNEYFNNTVRIGGVE